MQKVTKHFDHFAEHHVRKHTAGARAEVVPVNSPQMSFHKLAHISKSSKKGFIRKPSSCQRIPKRQRVFISECLGPEIIQRLGRMSALQALGYTSVLPSRTLKAISNSLVGSSLALAAAQIAMRACAPTNRAVHSAPERPIALGCSTGH
jgi:hypothetical protein